MFSEKTKERYASSSETSKFKYFKFFCFRVLFDKSIIVTAYPHMTDKQS